MPLYVEHRQRAGKEMSLLDTEFLTMQHARCLASKHTSTLLETTSTVHQREFFSTHDHPMCHSLGSVWIHLRVSVESFPSIPIPYSGDFRNDDWDPLHKDRVDLEEIVRNHYQMTGRMKSQQHKHNEIETIGDPTSYINDILAQAQQWKRKVNYG